MTHIDPDTDITMLELNKIYCAIKELVKARCAAETMEDTDGHIDEAIALLQAGEP
jgi:hypothetical protein